MSGGLFSTHIYTHTHIQGCASCFSTILEYSIPYVIYVLAYHVYNNTQCTVVFSLEIITGTRMITSLQIYPDLPLGQTTPAEMNKCGN